MNSILSVINKGGCAVAIAFTALSVKAQAGRIDPTFMTVSGFDSYITASALQPDGKILVVGFFSEFNGTHRPNLARLLFNGSLDVSFSPPSIPDGYPDTVLIDHLARILVGGDGFGVVRFMPGGMLDPTFNNPTSKAVWLGIDPFANLFFSDYRSFYKSHPNGSQDISFNIGRRYPSDPGIYAAAIKTNGNVVLGGGFYYINEQFRARIAEVNQFGQLLTTHSLMVYTAGRLSEASPLYLLCQTKKSSQEETSKAVSSATPPKDGLILVFLPDMWTTEEVGLDRSRR
jgi:hypothetical protein